MIPAHGTYARYVSRKHACRCKECSSANTEYHRARRDRLRGGPVKLPDHGTDAKWQRGCRCVPCIEANQSTRRSMYARRTPHGSRARWDSGCRCVECNRYELSRLLSEHRTESLGYERNSVFGKQKNGLSTVSLDRLIGEESEGVDFVVGAAFGHPALPRYMREWFDPTWEQVERVLAKTRERGDK